MKYIDQEALYDACNRGRKIFEHYFPNYDYGNPKAKIKEREKEKTASAVISFHRNLWKITDFGNQSELNGKPGVQYIMYRENLEYYEALLFVKDVIVGNTASDAFTPPSFKPGYEVREMTKDDKKGIQNFVYNETIPEKLAQNAFGRYVTPETLDNFNCRSVLSYEYCGISKKLKRDVVHKFIATDDYPIFVFDYGDFKKLYKPHDKDKKNRFVYVGIKPKNYVYGLSQLRKLKSEFWNEDKGENETPSEKPDAVVKDLFRCSGESDAMNLASLGFHVYWLNSESAEYPKGSYYELDSLCETHYQIMDLDFTGKQQAMKVALNHIRLKTLELPNYLNKKKDFRGNACKDLKDFVNTSGSDQDGTRRNFIVLMRRAKPMQFWEKKMEETKSGMQKITYNINLEFYYFFLQAHGFYVMDSKYHKKAGYCYARIDGKKVELIAPDDIKKKVKRFTKNWIRSKNLMDEIAILNKINSSNQISEANLQEIATFEPNFKNFDKYREVLNFKNGFSLQITRDKIERVKHQDLPNFILADFEMNRKKVHHLIQHSIQLIKEPAIEVNPSPKYKKLTEKLEKCKNTEAREALNIDIAKLPDTERYEVKINDPDFIYVGFLKDLAHIHWRKELEKKQKLTADEIKEQNLLLANMMFTLGYQISQYKDPSKPWLSLLQDLKISDVGQSSGRSGKSVLSLSITKVRPTFYIGGRKLEDRNQYNFIYDGFTEFHNNLEVDDFAEYGDFNFFYTQITGKREVNYKNISQDVLDYPDSGKMLMSTNFEIPNMHSSTLARLLNCAVSDYYHESTKHNDYLETRSPQTKYGKLMFDEFTEDEWNKFYNLIAYCVQLNKRFQKIQPPMGNLEKRQALRSMSRGLGRDNEFYSWANNYFINKPKNEVIETAPDNQGYFNTYVNKDVAFQNFQDHYLTSTQKAKYKAASFKKALIAFCEYYDLTFNPIGIDGLVKVDNMETDAMKRRIVKTFQGETKEYIYISSQKKIKQLNEDLPEDEKLTEEEMADLPL